MAEFPFDLMRQSELDSHVERKRNARSRLRIPELPVKAELQSVDALVVSIGGAQHLHGGI